MLAGHSQADGAGAEERPPPASARTGPVPRLEGADLETGAKAPKAKGTCYSIEFDPTNDQFAGTDYITVGYGRDYGDVAPVRGVMRTSGGQESRQAVDVIPLEDVT